MDLPGVAFGSSGRMIQNKISKGNFILLSLLSWLSLFKASPFNFLLLPSSNHFHYLYTMNIVSFKKSDKELFSQACKIRKAVFMEEMNVSAADEFEFDDESTHYLLYENNKALACSRWRETKGGIKLERFAVLKSHRSKGLGGIILKHMLEELIPSKKNIYLNAHVDAVNFYLKKGFVTIGAQFMEAGIKHMKMEYQY